MLTLWMLATIAAWLAAAWVVNRYVPALPMPFISKDQAEASPSGGMAMLFLWLFLIGSAVVVGGLSATMVYYLARGAGHYRQMPGDGLFAIGIVGNVAQLVGAICAVDVLLRCWPFAVAVGWGTMWALEHYRII